MSRHQLLAGALMALAATHAAQAREGAPTLDDLMRKVQELERRDQEKQREIDALRRQLNAVRQDDRGEAPSVAAAPIAPAASPVPSLAADPASGRNPTASPADQARGAVTSPGLAPLPLSGAGAQPASSLTAFNPAMSVILDGVYYNDNQSGRGPGILEKLAGVQNRPAESEGGDLTRGFNLRETELSFSASVDHYFDAVAILALGREGIEVEEAYGLTRSLPAGFQLKFGKFYSGIGYVNKQHPHQWDFVDQNLPYQTLFGGALNESGLQLTWLPRWPVYTLFGVEALQGDNGGVGGVLAPLTYTDAGGAAAPVPFENGKAGPRLFTGFVKVAPDLGYSNALQLGVSGGVSTQHQEAGELLGLPDYQAQQGSAWFLGADLVYKYDAPEAYGLHDFTLQSEYFYQGKRMEVVFSPADPALLGRQRRTRQDGFYVQGVYGIWPRWTTGLRYDVLGLTNHVDVSDGARIAFPRSQRVSADLTWNPTEFSRLRLQFSHGDFPTLPGPRERLSQIFLQYQLSLGAHGAHAF